MHAIGNSIVHARTFAVLLAVLGSASFCGCGATDRLEVSGEVTLDGQPVRTGSIAFLPTDSQSTAGSPGGVIMDGNFQIPAETGLTPGTYKAVVQAMKETGKSMEGPGGTSLPQTVPVAITEREGVDVEVTASGPNVFHIQVTSRAR